MGILRFAGYLLALLGIVAGGLLFLPAYGRELAIAPVGHWFLFLACLIAGLLLVALVSKETPRQLLQATGGLLVLIALVAVVGILFSAIGVLAATDPTNLWVLFLLCLPFGIVLVVAADKIGLKRKRTVTLQDVENAAASQPRPVS